MQRCSKCILPETYPGIVFNLEGVCNVCLDRTALSLTVKGKAELFNIVASLRNKGKYDCIVALSGGQDSTFITYYAVVELGLKVLAITMDNGFMPEQTKIDINETLKRFGLDHYNVGFDFVQNNIKHVLSSWIHSPSPAMIALLCTGCTAGIKRGLMKAARDQNVTLVLGGGGGIVGGGGEPTSAKNTISFAQQLMSLAPDTGQSKLFLLLGFCKNILDNPRYISSYKFIKTILSEYYYRFLLSKRSDITAIGLFEFVQWNEEEICSLIQSELNWIKPDISPTTWRSDCQIHLLKQYLYNQTLGFTKNDDLLSGMVRQNLLTRAEALNKLAYQNLIPKAFLESFLVELDLDLNTLDTALDGYRRKVQAHG